MDADDIKKIIQIEEIKDDEEMFSRFLVSNNENKKEFMLEKSEKKKDDSDNGWVTGWNTWAGDSKVIHAKEFLKRKRYQEIQHKKEIMENTANTHPVNVKINNSIDKKVRSDI